MSLAPEKRFPTQKFTLSVGKFRYTHHDKSGSAGEDENR